MYNAEYIDVDLALTRLGGNKTLYKKILQMFLDSADFENLKNAVAKQDYDAAAGISHSIKGAAGNLSLTAVFKNSSDLMETFKLGTFCEKQWEEYLDALDKTIDEINKYMLDKNV